ncbi:hypothetical protein [Spirosoma sordidisoli]|uniref:Uncharacterized protein n=1 Tax=Spirosoma sordidisoli TaxID=2502893 RepID=A0A4Q2UPC4_9BACT|nr:hypothetical protein [Spirosoma sordidisoli]RYC70732.1 hypothetical protein EQG79_00840 [Spirosoma sordidisoli]
MNTETKAPDKKNTSQLLVKIDSTCSGAWFTIVQPCIDPETQEEWDNEIARSSTAYVFDYEKYGNTTAVTYNERPDMWKAEPDHDEIKNLINLMATAPELFECLRDCTFALSDPNVSRREINRVLEQAASALKRANGN